MFCIETILFLSIFPFKQYNVVSSVDNDLETFEMDSDSYSYYHNHHNHNGANRFANVKHTFQNLVSSSILLNNKYALTIILCVTIGSIGSEFLQYWLTKGSRNFDLYDMIVNVLGSTLGLTLYYSLERWMMSF